MYRLALLLALLIAFAAGCGGSGDDDSKPPPSPVAQATGEEAQGQVARASAENEKKKKRTEEGDKEDAKDQEASEESDAPKTHEEIEEAQAKQYRSLKPKRRLFFVRTVARSVLAQYGLQLAGLELSDRGRDAEISITRKSACRAVASNEPNMTESMKHGVPGLRSVRWVVAGTGKELGYYVLNCPRPEMPDGPGSVVLTHTGVGGPWTSKVFEIKGKRWALEYENVGASLAVIVVPVDKKAKGRYSKPVGSQKPESGRNNYTGPGKYLLKVHGAGRWAVRVKEIR